MAVLGSLVSSGYRAGMDGIRDRRRTRSRVRWPSPAGPEARRAGSSPRAPAAFVDGMHSAVLVGAAIAVLGSVLALVALPARAPATIAHAPEPLAA